MNGSDTITIIIADSEAEGILDSVLVITSYSIHYTKLYEMVAPEPRAGRRETACAEPSAGAGSPGISTDSRVWFVAASNGSRYDGGTPSDPEEAWP